MTINGFTYEHTTGESAIQELSGDELQAFIDTQNAALARKESEAQALAEAKVKRDELLTRLGITAEEAKLLLS